MNKVTSIAVNSALGRCTSDRACGGEMPGIAAGADVGGIIDCRFGGGVAMNSPFATARTLAGGWRIVADVFG